MQEALPYLIFPGTCREALQFYETCLEGEITSIQTVGEAPMPMEVPAEHAHRIFDSEFRAENFRMKASDDMPGHEVAEGSNFAIFLIFNDSDKQQTVFNKLAEGGQVQFPLENNFGMLVDQYRVQWMLAFQ